MGHRANGLAAVRPGRPVMGLFTAGNPNAAAILGTTDHVDLFRVLGG